jgi:hypothetical protein
MALNPPGFPPTSANDTSFIYPDHCSLYGHRVYLWEIFRDNLDAGRLKEWMQKFKVRGDDYGIGI